MNDAQFDKIFGYLQQIDNRLQTVEDEVATRADIDKVITIIDGFAGKIDASDVEAAALEHKVNRLETYVSVLAKKADIDLDTVRT